MNQQPRSVELLGVRVDAITIKDAVAAIIERAGNKTTPAAYVTKPYVEFLDQAVSDPDLQQLLNGAWLSLPDGVALIWAAHYLYAGPRGWLRFFGTAAAIVLRPRTLRDPLPERFAGANFTWPLLEAAAAAGVSVFLIGSPKNGSIETTAEVIRKRLPGLHLAGTRSGRDRSQPAGHVGEAWVTETAEALRRAHASLILVGMGFPLQERIMARLADALPHGILIGEGGTFDYQGFGGTRQRAPQLAQKLGLEWLWRLALEPVRWRRQLAIPRFIWRIFRSRNTSSPDSTV